jgi:hypothetical protein
MTPHSLIVDRENRPVVCDRENDRGQLFVRDGRWPPEWRGLCRPMDLCERDDGVILVTDQVPSVNALAPNGARIGRGRPSLNGAHGIALGRAGEIYLAEIDPSVVTKLTRAEHGGSADRFVKLAPPMPPSSLYVPRRLTSAGPRLALSSAAIGTTLGAFLKFQHANPFQGGASLIPLGELTLPLGVRCRG